MNLARACGILIIAALAIAPAFAQQSFFETNIRPVLQSKCQSCHNDKNKSSGLSLSSRDALLAGGNRGPAIPLLARAVEQTGALKMPLGGKLEPEQIANIKRWVDMGAPWPAETGAAKKPGKDYWAFQPVKRVTPPAIPVPNPIDRFILARLQQEHLKPSPEADKETLLRRVSLDLTGLLPSAKEVQEFVADQRPDAYDRVVDRLLASPHYGERWGRHWLDVARYADSDGYTIDAPRQIWKYRDYVIAALNRDMPFNEFVIEQIAGDLLPNPTVDQLIATGFNRNTPSNFEGGIDFEQYRVEAVVDRVSTTGAAFLGLTLGCARCHDHKFDPISQKEFYQMVAFMNSEDEITSEAERYDFNRPFLEVPTLDELARRKAFQSQWSALSKELITYVRGLAASRTQDASKDPGLRERVKNLRDLRKAEPKVTTTLIMRELPQPRESYIHLGGDFTRKGAIVKPAVPAVLPQLPPNATSRLDLAKWLVDPQNPLTSRVTVNRIWQEYFGKGIVETENDFGTQGAKPTHPELLDWLASEFVRRNWSQKAIHRLIVTSATYRQSSKRREDIEEADPYNKLLARQNRLRLDAEIIRDAGLSASGLLTETVGGPSVYPPIPDGALAVTQVKQAWPTSMGPDRFRRGMYTFFRRTAIYPGLGVFDAPDAAATCTRRVRSNTPLQALTALNDATFIEFAEGLAARVIKEGGSVDRDRLKYAFLLTVGRPPKAAEEERLLHFLARQVDEYKTNPALATELIFKGKVFRSDEVPAENAPVDKLARNRPADLLLLAAWTGISRVLLNDDDFLTRE
ncbi:MAG: PSD1 and planctomycete cytochrome C domain-containing protein [Acidobacteriota bacterium]|nr:PSD1 and planctomycete cytochrome C domain-containing protein [Acidobacteriota bacterium]